jgi:hypothetical protein
MKGIHIRPAHDSQRAEEQDDELPFGAELVADDEDEDVADEEDDE